jgi:transcription initiation factor TFIIE subunit alpha
MFCDICHAEVVDNEDAESVQGSKDRMQRFNHQMRFIREGLQKSEAMILPQYVTHHWPACDFPITSRCLVSMSELG